MDVYEGFELLLKDRKKAWMITTLLPLSFLLVDIIMLTFGYSNSASSFLLLFGMFSGISLIPASLSYWMLGETSGYGGMTFLRAWRILSMIFPAALIFFGIFFILHLLFVPVVLGFISVGVGIACISFIKQAFLLRLAGAEAKKRKVADLLRRRKHKPLDLDRLRMKEEIMVKKALAELERKGR